MNLDDAIEARAEADGRWAGHGLTSPHRDGWGIGAVRGGSGFRLISPSGLAFDPPPRIASTTAGLWLLVLALPPRVRPCPDCEARGGGYIWSQREWRAWPTGPGRWLAKGAKTGGRVRRAKLRRWSRATGEPLPTSRAHRSVDVVSRWMCAEACPTCSDAGDEVKCKACNGRPPWYGTGASSKRRCDGCNERGKVPGPRVPTGQVSESWGAVLLRALPRDGLGASGSACGDWRDDGTCSAPSDSPGCPGCPRRLDLEARGDLTRCSDQLQIAAISGATDEQVFGVSLSDSDDRVDGDRALGVWLALLLAGPKCGTALGQHRDAMAVALERGSNRAREE